MGHMPIRSDLERFDDDDDPLDETQPCDPYQERRQIVETQLHADHPLLDDVERLMEHFEDTRFVRLWASSVRQRYSTPRLERPY